MFYPSVSYLLLSSCLLSSLPSLLVSPLRFCARSCSFLFFSFRFFFVLFFSCLVLSYPILSYVILPYLTLPYITSHHLIVHSLLFSYLILSYRFLSCLIVFHLISSYLLLMLFYPKRSKAANPPPRQQVFDLELHYERRHAEGAVADIEVK